MFQNATQNVSLARLLQALPDDVSEFDVYDWAGSTDTLAKSIAPEIEKLKNLEKLSISRYQMTGSIPSESWRNW